MHKNCKYKGHDPVPSLSGSGRKHKLSPFNKRKLVRMVNTQQPPNVSLWRIRSCWRTGDSVHSQVCFTSTWAERVQYNPLGPGCLCANVLSDYLSVLFMLIRTWRTLQPLYTMVFRRALFLAHYLSPYKWTIWSVPSIASPTTVMQITWSYFSLSHRTI